jgi:two-component system, OmpR family, sensor histidine kinase BaeS
MIGWIRRRLWIKLFITYLIIIAIGAAVLITTSRLVIPATFENHMASMSPMMSAMMGETAPHMEQNLYANFRAGVVEALSWSAAAAFLAAVVLSWFVSRMVVTPIQAMMSASQRIAEGHYQERVQVPGNVRQGVLDELALLALSFNQMASQLDKTEIMRRQMIGDVAHELRTPLTIIKGTMEALMDGVLPASAETYQQVHQEADRLQRLVADLQELSKVEGGAIDLNVQSLSVHSVVEKVISRFQQPYQAKSVALEMNAESETLSVLADEDRLQQILTNLLSNALLYTPSGGSVTVHARQEDQFVTFQVRDTGIGIPAEYLPHVFTRFYRIDKSRARASGGSGVGLTISKHLVEAQGGRIWVESDGPGKGSRFSFTLPSLRKQHSM